MILNPENTFDARLIYDLYVIILNELNDFTQVAIWSLDSFEIKNILWYLAVLKNSLFFADLFNLENLLALFLAPYCVEHILHIWRENVNVLAYQILRQSSYNIFYLPFDKLTCVLTILGKLCVPFCIYINPLIKYCYLS